MSLPCLRETPDGVYLAVKLQPRAARNQVQGLHGQELKIAVTAPPVDSAANEALLAFLAERLEVNRSRVKLCRGHTSRHKVLFIAGLGAPRVTRFLGQ